MEYLFWHFLWSELIFFKMISKSKLIGHAYIYNIHKKFKFIIVTTGAIAFVCIMYSILLINIISSYKSEWNNLKVTVLSRRNFTLFAVLVWMLFTWVNTQRFFIDYWTVEMRDNNAISYVVLELTSSVDWPTI